MGVYNQIGGIISLSAYALYIISIFRSDPEKRTRPSRSTWWILAFVGGLIALSSYSLGATESLWVQLAYVAGPLTIAFLSLWHGDGSGFTTTDIYCFIGAALCGGLWIVFDSPLIAFGGSMMVDLIGLVPTIKKAYLDPNHEDPAAWLLETMGSLVNMFGITTWWSFVHKDWIYALYLFTVNALIALLLVRRIFVSSQKTGT